MDLFKKMVLDGSREEAVGMYSGLTGCDRGTAEAVVERLGYDISVRTVLGQRLSRAGLAMLAVLTLAAAGLFAAWMFGAVGVVPAIVASGMAVFHFAVFSRAIAASIRFRGLKKAGARVLKYFTIGKMKVRGGYVHAVKLYVEVAPGDGANFRAEMIVPVSDKGNARLKEGLDILVRYDPGNMGKVVIESIPDDNSAEKSGHH